MALATDDHVVMNDDAELLGGGDDELRHVDVGPRRLRIGRKDGRGRLARQRLRD